MSEKKYEPLTKCVATNTWINYIKAQGWNIISHFNSIFSNLILNALMATDKEIKEIRISIETLKKDGQIQIQVQDNGPGIPENHLHEIFEPFFSTKPSSGTGLGLGIVKRLVQLYGGRIEVETKIKEGSCFMVLFPIVR
jgi:signal transduction histidine kinase